MDNYSKFLEDPKFIDWILSGELTNDQYWKEYIKFHPDEKEDILQLKEVLSYLITDDKHPTAKERSELLMNLSVKVKEIDLKAVKNRRKYNILAFAASLLIFLSVGIYYYSTTKRIDYQQLLADKEDIYNQKSIQLILSDTTHVSFEKNDAIIDYSNENGIVVDRQDTIQSKSILTKKGKKLNRLAVPYGKRTRLKLSDGTVVHVNSGSQLIYPENFDKNKREIFLNGEAYFDVTRNDMAPFIVKTPQEGYYIEVLGTKFNLSAYEYDRRFEAVLTKGSINVVHENGLFFHNVVQLSPGEMALWDKKTEQHKVFKVNTDNYTLWTEGILLFENEELNRIVKRLERYFNIEIRIKDPLNGSIFIGGKLDLNGELDIVLENLALTASLDLRKINDEFYEIN